MVHEVTEIEFHSVIKSLFQNDDYLRKIEDNMKSRFSLLPRKLCV